MGKAYAIKLMLMETTISSRRLLLVRFFTEDEKEIFNFEPSTSLDLLCTPDVSANNNITLQYIE